MESQEGDGELSICKDKFIRNFERIFGEISGRISKMHKNKILDSQKYSYNRKFSPKKENFDFEMKKNLQIWILLLVGLSLLLLKNLTNVLYWQKATKEAKKEMKTYQSIQRIFTSHSFIESLLWPLVEKIKEIQQK